MFAVDDQPLESVHEFVYLGQKLTGEPTREGNSTKNKGVLELYDGSVHKAKSFQSLRMTSSSICG